MFLGEFQHSIDDKGRLKLPAKFNDAFADGAVIAERFDGALALYTMLDFPKVAAKYRDMDDFDPDERALRRDAFASAETVSPDKGGRIVIPSKMRDIAGPGDEVCLTGNWDHLEIWPKSVWEAYRNQAKETREIKAKKLASK